MMLTYKLKKYLKTKISTIKIVSEINQGLKKKKKKIFLTNYFQMDCKIKHLNIIMIKSN